jgi:hypothetical protein
MKRHPIQVPTNELLVYTNHMAADLCSPWQRYCRGRLLKNTPHEYTPFTVFLVIGVNPKKLTKDLQAPESAAEVNDASRHPTAADLIRAKGTGTPHGQAARVATLAVRALIEEN